MIYLFAWNILLKLTLDTEIILIKAAITKSRSVTVVRVKRSDADYSYRPRFSKIYSR